MLSAYRRSDMDHHRDDVELRQKKQQETTLYTWHGAVNARIDPSCFFFLSNQGYRILSIFLAIVIWITSAKIFYLILI